MSPDWSAAPEAVPYADLSDPQTLNLYAYAENNPVTRTDADGHTPIDDTWMQTGHDMQEVGIESFHLWVGQAENQDFEFHPPCICSGPAKSTANVPEPTNEHGKPSPPPVPLPPGKNGKPNSWRDVQGTPSRPRKWVPIHPVPSDEGGQPSASWDPEGHWDFDPGDGTGRQRFAPNGTPITPEEAHGKATFLKNHAGALAAGAVLLGGAAILATGGTAAPVLVPILVF